MRNLFTGKISPILLAKCQDHARKLHVARVDQDECNNDVGGHRYIRKLIGKIGEVGATEAGYPGDIDWDIWRRPATLPDLCDNIWVKTCSAEEMQKYGLSWVIDNYLFFYPQDKLVVLTVVDVDGRFGVLGHATGESLLGRYGPTRSPVLRERKKAIWYDDQEGGPRGVKDLVQACPVYAKRV